MSVVNPRHEGCAVASCGYDALGTVTITDNSTLVSLWPGPVEVGVTVGPHAEPLCRWHLISHVETRLRVTSRTSVIV